MKAQHQNGPKRRVWDLPTRSFHWLLVGSFAVAFVASGDSRYLDVHIFAGYVFGALVAFRLVWGRLGSRHARFREFAFGWRAVSAYLGQLGRGGGHVHYDGHNPAGAWAILAMLSLAALIAVSGLVVLGGQEGFGPLSGLIPRATGVGLRPYHEVLAWMMLALVGIHIAGVVVETLLHRENLVASMISGYKRGHGESVPRYRWIGVSLPLIAIITAFLSFKGYLFDTAEQPYRPFVAQALPQDEAWRAECGDCHLAYHPSLLPRRSWQALLAGQDDHFGEFLDLDEASLAGLASFANQFAAESGLTEAAWFINATTPADQTPLQIIKTSYWRERHKRIPERYWKAKKTGNGANCEVCHLDAKDGTFEDGAMRLPKLADESAAMRLAAQE